MEITTCCLLQFGVDRGNYDFDGWRFMLWWDL